MQKTSDHRINTIVIKTKGTYHTDHPNSTTLPKANLYNVSKSTIPPCTPTTPPTQNSETRLHTRLTMPPWTPTHKQKHNCNIRLQSSPPHLKHPNSKDFKDQPPRSRHCSHSLHYYSNILRTATTPLPKNWLYGSPNKMHITARLE